MSGPFLQTADGRWYFTFQHKGQRLSSVLSYATKCEAVCARRILLDGKLILRERGV